ncbi:S-layer homology domain-containing protein, partial [Paenibacillus sonchi]
TPAAGTAAFADMNGHWAAPAVDRLAATGILQGDGQGQFGPGSLPRRNGSHTEPGFSAGGCLADGAGRAGGRDSGQE